MSRIPVRRLPLLVVLASIASIAASPLAATTYMMMSDQALTDRATAVVDAKVVGVEPAPFNGPVATDYLIEVDRVLKGGVTGSTVVVRVPGGQGANGLNLKIWGAPEFYDGERVILFLTAGQDGTYRLLHLMLGAFHERDTVGRQKVLVRELSEAHAVDGNGTDPVRNLDKFADWITDRGFGIQRKADYQVTGAAAKLAELPQKFVLLQAREDGFNIRWFRFDGGGTVNWQVNERGQPGLSLEDTVDAFKTALTTWNNDAGTNIRYNYLGTTGIDKGLTESDGVNTILFDDPYAGQANREVQGSFDCSEGGVIAIGGPWFYSTTRIYAGKPYHEAVEADIVTNDGTECLFKNNAVTAAEVFTHELGHTLGLGHSLLRAATMYANVHDHGWGSKLNPDDVAGLAALYNPNGATVPTKPPAAPTNLTAKATSSTEATLTWRDKANNEDGFSIEVKVGRGKFQVAGTIPANVTGVPIIGLTPGQSYTIRMRAFNAKGNSKYSNAAVLKMPRN